MARNVSQFPLEALGSVRMATLTAAINLTGIPSNATTVWLTADTQSVRITLDGTTPTATIGQLIVAGTEGVIISVTDLAAILVIETAASAALNVTYFRPQPTG